MHKSRASGFSQTAEIRSEKISGKRDLKPIEPLENLLQDERLSPIGLILLQPFPALFLPVPAQFAGIRAGGAHTGHMNGPTDLAIGRTVAGSQAVGISGTPGRGGDNDSFS